MELEQQRLYKHCTKTPHICAVSSDSGIYKIVPIDIIHAPIVFVGLLILIGRTQNTIITFL